MNNDDNRIPSRLIIVAGTYDGVLAGWDTVEHNNSDDSNDEQNNIKNDIDLKLLKRKNDGIYLKLSFAMAAHEGSVRCIDVASGGTSSVPPPQQKKKDDKKKKRPRSNSITSDASSTLQQQQPIMPGILLSGGYDETINVYNLQKHNQIGELKTPNDLGSPLCCAFAPPSNNHHLMMSSPTQTATTHALVGLTSGKIILYKKRDWSIQHILSGHDAGGVQCLAVHPTGKMALSGGRSDGKIILWDLMKGRLAYVIKLPKLSNKVQCVNHIVWSADGTRYAYCYGSKITARVVAMNATSDEEEEGDSYLLDVQMPSRVNQLAFIGGPEGMFLCAACDDGGLPVLEVGQLLLDDEEDSDEEEKISSSNVKNERRAIMAIEPVDKVVAGDERFKCIQSVEGGSGFLVVTANSGGVVSLMDLEGAARMMLTPASENEGSDDDDESKSDEDSEDGEDDDEVEAAVEILDSVRIGSGARITDLACWSCGRSGDDDGEVELDNEDDADIQRESIESEEEEVSAAEEDVPTATKKKGSRKKENDNDFNNKIELDDEAVEKARKLVVQAKKHQKKKKKKRANQS